MDIHVDIHRDIHLFLNILLDIQSSFWIFNLNSGYPNQYPFQNYRYPLWISILILDILLDIQLFDSRPPGCFALLPISHLFWILVCALSSG